MGRFLESEKLRQVYFKETSATVSELGRQDGFFRGRARPFCLHESRSVETLYPSIREEAVAFFNRNRIRWHQGIGNAPSNHLCDSMVCGVNFLFPFSRQPEALADLLRPFYPDLARMQPIEDGHYLSFEWIGERNYLEERISRSGRRTRGANFTSADAIVMFERLDGSRQIVLIEWKYTESYGGTSYKIAKSGTDRSLTYLPLYKVQDCIIDSEKLADFDTLFFEPFYQFMRQQLLAQEMEKAGEMGADFVSLLHISPRKNIEFRKVTSPTLRNLAPSATGVWKQLLRQPDRFLSVYTDELFGRVEHPAMQAWKAYIQERYPSVMASE